MAWLAALWGRFQGTILAIGGVLVAVIAIFYNGKSAGREQAERKQREVNDAARERMDAVKPADAGSTIDSLRKGDF